MSAKVTAILALEMQDNATAKLKEASENLTKTTEQTAQKIQFNYKNIAFGATAAATGIVSFATSFDSLNRSSLTAQKAQLGYEKAQNRVNEMQKAGKTSTEEYRLAVETARLAQEKAKLAQDAYSDKVLNFAVGIAPQFISIGLGIQKTLEGFGITSLAQIPKILGFGAAHTTTMGAVTGSTTIATFSMHGLAAGIRAVISAHPIVFIALTALSVLITLLMTNTFGLRDAFANLGKMIFEFIDQHLKPLADLLRFLNDNAIQPITRALGIGVPEAADKASKGFDNTARSADNLSQSVKQVESSFTQLSSVISHTSEQSKNLQDITFGTILTMRDQITTIQLTASEVQKLNIEFENSIKTKEKDANVTKLLVDRHRELAESFENARAKAFGTAQGRIDVSRQESNIFARSIQDEVTAQGGLTPQEYTSALLLSNVSAGQESAAIWSSPKFIWAVNQILRGKEFNAAQAVITKFGIQSFYSSIAANPSRFREFQSGRPDTRVAEMEAIERSRLATKTMIDVARMLQGLGPVLNSEQQRMQVAEILRSFGLERFLSAKHGFEGFVDKPTLFLTGEAGREHVKVTPNGNSENLTAKDIEMIRMIVRETTTQIINGMEGR